LSGRTLDRFFGEGRDASGSLKETSLNELCSLLIKHYTWNNFILENPAPFDEQVPNQLFINLTESWQRKIIQSINNKLRDYSSFENYLSGVRKLKELKGVQEDCITNLEIKNFASKIYIELITRKGAIPIDIEHDVIEEIYDSWFKLFCIIREEIKLLPSIYLTQKDKPLPISLSIEILNEILRPHLTQHQAKYRHWLGKEKSYPKNRNLTPQELQKKYASYSLIIESIKSINQKLINASQQFQNFS
jgi:hypothetical protein